MRPIPGYEGLYSVTEDGKVFSHLRNKFLALKRHQRGKVSKELNYTKVSLCKGGSVKLVAVHRLVATAYIPNPENKPQVNHIDGIRSNNSVSNLEWATAKENIAHAIRTGLLDLSKCKSTSRKGVNRGVKNGSSKLTEEEVRHIRNIYKPYDKEFNSPALAKKFGVSKPAILALLGKGKKKTYTDVI